MNSPIKLKPVFKEIVWGGNRLKTDYGFESELNNIAEAWMLCAREDGDNIIGNGEYKGTSFKEFIKHNKYSYLSLSCQDSSAKIKSSISKMIYFIMNTSLK